MLETCQTIKTWLTRPHQVAFHLLCGQPKCRCAHTHVCVDIQKHLSHSHSLHVFSVTCMFKGIFLFAFLLLLLFERPMEKGLKTADCIKNQFHQIGFSFRVRVLTCMHTHTHTHAYLHTRTSSIPPAVI